MSTKNINSKFFTKVGFIDLADGTSVVSTDDGTVVFRGSLSGYGNTVIVDHDDHYYSVYAGLAVTEATTGDRVLRGQKLAPPAVNFTSSFATSLNLKIRHIGFLVRVLFRLDR
jgi:septal ring factor EnvC (AmiA/AmiB activator)